MIGIVLIALGVFCFMSLGYVILMGSLTLLIYALVALSFVAIGVLVVYGALWEFWFPKPAKTLIANKRAPSFELKYDDVGYAELLPSRKYFPEGLITYKFGWALLPRPIRKFFEEITAKKKPGRKAKKPEDEEKRQKTYQDSQIEEFKKEERERELAESIALKKYTLKGTGKPIWLQFEGLAANFNPQILVPLEAKQDNPHLYFDQFKEAIGKIDLTEAARGQILEKLEGLKSHVERIRVVIDPRRFKEIHPKMYTQSHIDAHGRIHFELGKLSVEGIPMKYIMIILVVLGVVGALAAVYFLFMQNQQPPRVQAQPAKAIISLIRSKLLGVS